MGPAELVSLLSTLASLGGPADPLAMDSIQEALLHKGVGQVGPTALYL